MRILQAMTDDAAARARALFEFAVQNDGVTFGPVAIDWLVNTVATFAASEASAARQEGFNDASNQAQGLELHIDSLNAELAAARQEAEDYASALADARFECGTMRAERDEAREVVAKVNNSFGSYGYFTEPHPADEVERLKAHCRAYWREIESLRAALGAAQEALKPHHMDSDGDWLEEHGPGRCEGCDALV